MLKTSDKAASQLAYADKIYLSKCNLVSENHSQSMQALILKLNPFAYFFSGKIENISTEQLLKVEVSKRPVITLQDKNFKPSYKQIQHESFASIALEFTDSFDTNKLFERLSACLSMQVFTLFRVKGIFYDSKKTKKMILQSVMSSVFIDEAENWEANEIKKSKIVFVGKYLIEDELKKMIQKCIVKDNSVSKIIRTDDCLINGQHP